MLSDVDLGTASLRQCHANCLIPKSRCSKAIKKHCSVLTMQVLCQSIMSCPWLVIAFPSPAASWFTLVMSSFLGTRSVSMIYMRVPSSELMKLRVKMIYRLMRLSWQCQMHVYLLTLRWSWNITTCGKRWQRMRICHFHHVNESFQYKMVIGMWQSMVQIRRHKLVRVRCP
jgi:hypothetical protein